MYDHLNDPIVKIYLIRDRILRDENERDKIIDLWELRMSSLSIETKDVLCVVFFNHVELSNLELMIQDGWEAYSLEYPYSTMEDYYNNSWKPTVSIMDNYLSIEKLDIYINSEYWSSKALDEDVYIQYYFYERKRTPEYYRQYFPNAKEVIQNSFPHLSKLKKDHKEKSIKQKDNLNTFQKEIISSLYSSNHRESHIYRFLKGKRQFSSMKEIDFVLFLNSLDNGNRNVNKRYAQGKTINFTASLIEDFQNLLKN